MSKPPAKNKVRSPKREARVKRNPDQLKLGEKPVDQAELFADQPGGKQPAARLRQIRESMEATNRIEARS